MPRRLLPFVVVAAICTVPGCAARQPPAPIRDVAAIEAHADGLARAGCYQCLKDALAMLPAGAAFDPRRFRLLVLAAARVRELGLIGEPDWLGGARDLAGVSPTAVQQLLIDLASATVMPRGTRQPMPSGGAVERLNREQLGTRAVQQLASLGQTDVAAAYFLQHAMCSDLGLGPEAAEISEAMRRVPLVAYRLASCSRVDGEALDALLAAEPRLVELHYFKATAAFVAGALLTTERELREFDARFPAAPASALLRGQVLLALEEFEAAAAAFDVVLATDAGQPEALLYRMRAVSQLGDAARGEAASDRLVTLGTWYQGEAYYWRAWNRRALGRLDQAASDIETAKRVLFNAAVPKLAGFIAFDRQQLELALTELTTSRERNGNDCEVLFAIGQVHARHGRWAEAAESFAVTIGCTQAAQAAARTRMDEVAVAPLDPPRRARLQARAERDRATEHTREGLATFNAATAHVLAGHADHARPLAERALAWHQWAGKAKELLDGLAARRN
jgi:tetratricopeptide (TPR) repeat protein